MGFNYKSSKENQDNGWQWTAYSDLFTALSAVFLLLYIISNIQNGASGVQQQQQVKKLAQEAEALREQIRVYNTLKDDYLNKGATEDEQATYEQLMDKLKLLQEENHGEAAKLRAQAKDNDQKELALNKYQQMIRNIMNANLISQARLKKKDQILEEKAVVIEQKDQTLDDRLTEIRVLERDVTDRKKEIEQGELKISQIESQLETRAQQLKLAYKQNKISKEKYQNQLASLQVESSKKIDELKTANTQAQTALSQVNEQLSTVSSKLSETEGNLKVEKKRGQELAGALEAEGEKARSEIARLKGEFDVKSRLDAKKFGIALAQERLGAAAEKAKREAFEKDMGQKKAALDGKVASLERGLAENQKELKKAQEALEARKKLAKQINENFKKAGVEAEVDMGTGDVTLSFGKHYFDTGRASLKGEMVDKLKKLIPAYSQSLFQDAKTSQKIKSVEIVGFASPTFNGKYIDPDSLDVGDRKAVNFNLDLSFNRAKSIFNFIFDTNKMAYKHQKQLLPLVKVTGRSYLAEGAKGRSLASGISEKEYCAKFDCNRSQRVIIKFNLEN